MKIRFDQPWNNIEIYDKARHWLENHHTSFRLCGLGISYINGRVYHSEIEILEDEEATLFILSFPDLIKWTQR